MSLDMSTSESCDQQALSAFTPSIWHGNARDFVEDSQHVLRVALYRVSSGFGVLSQESDPPMSINDTRLFDLERCNILQPSTAPGTITAAPFSTQGIPSRSAWEKHRARILHLYLQENTTLNEIMQIMQREHSFKATVKMYKSRLKSWNARKYMTKTERDFVSRALRDKKYRGEPYGRVIVRGKDKKLDIFLRHMGHSRAHRGSLDDNSNSSQDIIVDSLMSPSPPISPAGIEMTVAILCREMPHLVLKTPGDGVSYELFYAIKQACTHFHDQAPAKVRISLNLAAEWFRANLKARPALVLMSLLRSQTITGYEDFYRAEMFKYIYEHLLNLAKEIHGPQHVLTILLSHILQMSIEPKVMQSAYQHVVPHIIALLQKQHSSETYRWQELLATRLSKAGNRAKAGQLLEDAVSSFGKDDIYKDRDRWKCVLTLARHYILHASDKDEEAEYMLRLLLEAGTDARTREVSPWHANFVFNGLGQLAEKRGDLEAAVYFYQLRTQGAAKLWGENTALTLHALEHLARLLRILGREGEAVVLEKRIQLKDELEEGDFH
jgi:hypothetical protein